jgi:putative acyl-CoA dehydrogenase
LECLGGNGYVEDSDMPRLYREAPLCSIWEGSGNVICLDVLRAWQKDPIARESLVAELNDGRRLHPALDPLIETALRAPRGEEEARRYAMNVAVALQGILMFRHAEPSHAEAFVTTDRGRPFGALCQSV